MLGILRLIHLGFTSSGVSLAGPPPVVGGGPPLVRGRARQTSQVSDSYI